MIAKVDWTTSGIPGVIGSYELRVPVNNYDDDDDGVDGKEQEEAEEKGDKEEKEAAEEEEVYDEFDGLSDAMMIFISDAWCAAGLRQQSVPGQRGPCREGPDGRFLDQVLSEHGARHQSEVDRTIPEDPSPSFHIFWEQPTCSLSTGCRRHLLQRHFRRDRE